MAGELDLAEQLLRRAADDEAAAKALLSVKSVTDAIVAQHAQQGVEKAIKATLASQDIEFPFIHDIAGLMILCTNAGIQVPEQLRDADQLTPYAGALRYGEEGIDLVDRNTALSWVTTAVEWARGVIEREAQQQQPPRGSAEESSPQ
jgi:HEPN domain-containing protein